MQSIFEVFKARPQYFYVIITVFQKICEITKIYFEWDVLELHQLPTVLIRYTLVFLPILIFQN